MIATTPIAVEKSVRNEEIRSLTSTQAGKIVPLAYIPLLREDRVSRGSLKIAFDMAETLHPLLNAVNVTCHAYFLSNLMQERFEGMDELNRSYQGIPEKHNSTVIPWVVQVAYDPQAAFWRKLGVQWPSGAMINKAPIEFYNQLVNYRRRSRSEKLPIRGWSETTLAEAFWHNTNLGFVVPDWDQAAMEGEVPLSFDVDGVAVRGIGHKTGTTSTILANNAVLEYDANDDPTTTQRTYSSSVASTDPNLRIKTDSAGVPAVFAELSAAGITLSLANIELAKQTAAFAKLRQKYDGIKDDYIIDLLMEGVRIPDLALTKPILLDRKSTIFGYTERHAMDGDNLDVSRTTGRTDLTLNFRLPPVNTGGVIMITCEIVPEQLYERQYDEYLGYTDASQLPNFMRDYLDPEKVEVVKNKFVDVLHDTPEATFGYAPLNYKWKRSLTRAGGKFFRPDPATFVEDRQRFWSADQENPTLSDDFYMVSDLPHSVFADTISDSFEILTIGTVNIIGNTVFGDGLEEDTNSYEEIMEQVDSGRIVQEEIPVAAAKPAASTKPVVTPAKG